MTNPPTQPRPPAVSLCDVSFRYPSADHSPAGIDDVVKIPHWQVQQGEHVFLSGPSGSGKSTLLNLLCGTLQPTKGSISLFGTAFSSLSSSKRDRYRANHIGVVFQQFNLIDYLTVEQNVEAAVYFSGTSGAQSKQRIHTRLPQLLEALQLPATIAHKQAGELSVGQQQRVAIVRALINSPELLIVDEPTSALDVAARDTFMTLLKQVANKSTLLFVSHDPSLQAYFHQHVKMDDINQIASTNTYA